MKKWISITTDIFNNLLNVSALVCPSCHKLGVDFQFIGDLKTRIGFMVVWCPFCLHGIQLSRVRIPEQKTAFSFDILVEKISNRIPNFIDVNPVARKTKRRRNATSLHYYYVEKIKQLHSQSQQLPSLILATNA